VDRRRGGSSPRRPSRRIQVRPADGRLGRAPDCRPGADPRRQPGPQGNTRPVARPGAPERRPAPRERLATRKVTPRQHPAASGLVEPWVSAMRPVESKRRTQLLLNSHPACVSPLEAVPGNPSNTNMLAEVAGAHRCNVAHGTTGTHRTAASRAKGTRQRSQYPTARSSLALRASSGIQMGPL
jgi:hypothetical protein